jgi:hypothetical protein
MNASPFGPLLCSLALFPCFVYKKALLFYLAKDKKALLFYLAKDKKALLFYLAKGTLIEYHI